MKYEITKDIDAFPQGTIVYWDKESTPRALKKTRDSDETHLCVSTKNADFSQLVPTRCLKLL